MEILEYSEVDTSGYKSQSWGLLSEDGRGPWFDRRDRADLLFKPHPQLLKLLEDPRFKVRNYSTQGSNEFSSFNAHAYGIAQGLYDQLKVLLSLRGGNLHDKRILDLGCGSNESFDTKYYDHVFWQPWLCRFLNQMGVGVMGVDIGDLEGEDFQAFQADLLAPDSLDTIDTRSIDLVNIRLVFNSPQLQKTTKGEFQPGSYHEVEPGLLLESALLPQLKRVTKPDGVVIYHATTELFKNFNSRHWIWSTKAVQTEVQLALFG